MTETIKIYLKPIANVGGLILGYHETLVYTNSSGHSFYSSAGPSIPLPNNLSGLERALENLYPAYADVSTNTPSSFGTLIASNINTPFNPNQGQQITTDNNGHPYQSLTVASASDLSSQWASITASYDTINAAGLTYSPLSQNSNTAANNALSAAGLSLPSGLSSYTTWAGDVPLPLLASSSDTFVSSSITDGSGNIIDTIVAKDGSGTTIATITIDKTAVGKLMNFNVDNDTGSYNGSYYIVQSGDVGTTTSDTWNNIASQAGIYDGFSITGSQLSRLNNALGVNPGSDNTIYVPTASISVGTTPNDLTGLPPDQNYIYDSASGTAYSIGAGLGFGDGLPGSLYVLNSDGAADIFAPGTWQTIANDTGNDSTNVDLKDAGGDKIGTLAIDKTTGDAVLVGNNGSPTTETLSHSHGPIAVIRNADGSDTVLQLGGAAWHVNADGSLTSAINPFPDGGTLALGKYTSSLTSLFNRTTTDPIVLDLSSGGTGVELISLTNSSAYFDLHDSGFAVHTGWVGPTTGILVHTATPTSIGDLFGNSSTNGFTALKAADTNSDGVIDSGDAGFSSLYVWQDVNGNGVADSGEVETLSSLGISSISLAPNQYSLS